MPSNQWLTNEAQPIGAGWGGPPQLSAPNISGLVEAILRNKLARDKMTQENIADTIKNVRSERQSNEYLEAMKAAGLIPQDYEAGGLGGAKMGTGLAEMIQRKNEFEAREEHRRAMEARPTGRGSRGGGSGDRGDEGVATQVETPEDYYGLSVAPGAPSQQTTRTVNGVVQVKKARGRWETGPKWMQNQGAEGGGKTGDISKSVKERMNLVDQYDTLEADRKKQEVADITAGRADVPFKQSDLYNMTKNRLKQLEEVPGMPSTAPAERPPAADTAGGHAQDYGTKAVYMKAPDGTVSPVDPNLVEYYKSKGAVIVPGT